MKASTGSIASSRSWTAGLSLARTSPAVSLYSMRKTGSMKSAPDYLFMMHI